MTSPAGVLVNTVTLCRTPKVVIGQHDATDKIDVFMANDSRSKVLGVLPMVAYRHVLAADGGG